MSEGDFDPSAYPPVSEVGHGRYRISWWKPGVLAGIEVWPDPVDDGPTTPIFHFVLTTKKPDE